MHTTCPYRLESPSGLTVCIVSRLNQQIKVMCRCSLLKCKVCTVKVIDLVKIEALWMARIWGDAMHYEGPPLLSCCSGFPSATLVEHVVRLTCFCRVWCEWYGLNIMWWSVCNDFCDLHVTVTTTGLRLSHYCIMACVSTCDACSPHVIYFTSAVRCNSLVLILGGFKHEWRWRSPQDRMDDNRGHMEPWRWSPLWCKRPFYSQYDMIIWLWCLFSCHTVLLCFFIWAIYFYHDRIVSL